MISDLRQSFNRMYSAERYAALLSWLEKQCGAKVEFRVAETPIFVPLAMLDGMAAAGMELAKILIGWPEYIEAAQNAIPDRYRVAGTDAHPQFLTADFALVRDGAGGTSPRLVEIQAFPSVYGYQSVLAAGYREIYGLDPALGSFVPHSAGNA